VIPQEFTVDNFQNIPDPCGYSGVKVGANFHIITGDKMQSEILTVLKKLGFSNREFGVATVASAATVMCDMI